MLKGTVKYTDDSNSTFTYNVEAIDTSTMFSMKLSSFSANAVMKMQGEGDDEAGFLEERRFDVSLAHIVVETNTYTENNKTKKHPVNTDLFCRLGALIRYAKMQCTAQHEVGYTGLRLASKEFEAVTSKEYVIPYTHPSLSGKIYARVRLSYGDIISLDIDSPSFVIHLDSDNGETDLFKPIKNGQKLGIKFDEDYLGFPIKAQEIVAIPNNNGMYTCIEDIVKAHPDKEFSWLLEKDYHIVDDEHLEEICKYILDDKWEYVYYDTETTGLDINFKSRIGQADQLVGVVLSVKYGESFFFPTQMKSIPNLCGGDHFYFMEKYMRPILEGKKLVAHNMSFDWKVAYIYDINANIVHDTMALIKLTIGAERKNYPIGLKDNARLLLGRDSLELSDLVVDNSWGQSEIRFWDLPYELVRLYACADTDNTKGLLDYAVQTDLLNRYNATKVYEIEIAFSFAVAYQEFYGHHIDVNNLSEIREEIRKGQEECMSKMEEIVGREFNPNSPKVLLDIMYNQLGIPTQISRKTGKPTTDKETLKYLAELTDTEDNVKYPFCKLLQKFREYEGIRKTVDKFPEYMTADGYLFSSVMQYGTTTGRVSINKPNYQSYNDPIKKNVIPRPGYWMFDTDYSSVEYRVLGNMVGNKRIMDNFRDPDFDYHAYQAAHMYNVPYSAVTKKLRKAAKSINFGLPYGMGDESLGAKIFGEATPENTRKAAALRQAYFKGQEDIRDWFEYHRARGVAEGFTETYFGRRRYYHKQDFSAAKIRRQAGNFVIQGTAADIYKTAVGRVFKRICREGWLGKVLFTGFIHDELLGEVTNDIDPAYFLKVLREEFEVKITNSDGTPWSPLYMGFGYGMSWYEAKSVELPIKLQWEIVDRYAKTGFPEWHGDGRAFCDTIPDKLRDFEVRDIRNQLLDPASQNKEIKPTLNNQVLDCVKEDSKLYAQGISEYMTSHNITDAQGINKDDLISYLDKTYHIQSLMFDSDNNLVTSFEPTKDTQTAITLYCELHATDRDKINISDISEVDSSADNLADAEYYIPDYYDEDDLSPKSQDYETRLQQIKDTKIDTLGMYVDIDKKEVTLKVVPDNYMAFIQSRSNKEGKGYRIYFKDSAKKQMFVTSAYLESQEINIIQQMYIQYLTQKR